MFYNYIIKFIDYKLNKNILKYLTQFKKNNYLYKSCLITIPKKINKFTVLRSPHVHKKSREQFEFILYRNTLTFDIYSKKRKKINKLFSFIKKILLSEISSTIIKNIRLSNNLVINNYTFIYFSQFK